MSHAEEQRLELWSELRSPATDPVGRVGEVQPDYRLRAAGAGPAATTDFLVVECKQYKRSSKRNFSAALTDYARASPFAQVVLVNYGPVLPSVLATVPDDVVDSCHAHGRVLPGGEGLPLFVSAVTNVALGVLGHPLAAHWLITEIEATILWGGRDVDLDLWMTTPEGSCGFARMEGLAEVEHSGDDRGSS